MFVALTDLVTCPRCGPGWGLVLLADRVEDRRVLSGRFGCPACRGTFRVESGFAELRPAGAGGEPDAGVTAGPAADRAGAVRLAALLGLGEGAGHPLLVGTAARFAGELAALVPGLEVVAVGDALRGWPEAPGVSRIAAAGRLPFRDRSMRGVALGGEVAGAFLEEGARVLGAAGRLVVEGAPADAEARLARVSLDVIVREGGAVVARRR